MEKEPFTFDEVYDKIIVPHFTELEKLDTRGSNASYSISDVCKSGFAVYSLKAPSLLAFRPKTEAEIENMKRCFRIDEIASDNGLRTILDKVNSDELRSIFPKVISYLKEHGALEPYKVLGDCQLVSIDGVHHYNSKKIKCDCCIERKHRDGSVSYNHSMLSAAIVHPKKREVFVMDNEPIVQQDGSTKNDCEQNAAKRLLNRLSGLYASESIVYVLDALYGCAPVIKLIEESAAQWDYIINCTEKGHPYLFDQFDQANEAHQVEWNTWRRKDGTYQVGFINELCLNASNSEVKVNMMIVNYKSKKEKQITFSWITSLEINRQNAMQIVEAARSRWKIENEVFNTLKNQQYNFEHSFGHGKKNLATNFAYLMMLAFLVDQIRQFGSRIFISIWKGLQTKRAVWEAMRVIFKTMVIENVTDLSHKVLSIYQLRMIRI